GLDLVKPEQEAIRRHVATIQEVAATLDPTTGRSAARRCDFDAILTRLEGDDDPVHEHMADLMDSFRAGLLAGGDDLASVQDDLDLERWFRLAKGHERRIHGHKHTGVRLVQEGATLMPVLDAHQAHPGPFTAAELLAYREAHPPPDEQAAVQRRKVMRKARSKK